MKSIIAAISLFLLITLTGCMEIETRIIMQLDGGAIIKETVSIHKELLDFTDESGKSIVMQYLEKSACEDRGKLFGNGTVLTSHAIKSLNGGVKVSIAEYRIPDINDLYLINPFLCYSNYKEMGYAKLKLEPVLGSSYFGRSGEMKLSVTTEKPGVSTQKRWTRGEPLIKSPSPLVLQKYRNLQPIFKDLLKEFKVSVVFECYSALYTNFGYRDRSAQPRSCEIFSFSGSDYDNTGGMLLDNDEIMQELLRQCFWDFNFIRASQDFSNNATVPVITDTGSPYMNHHGEGSGGIGIFFKTSKPIFNKYFNGKTITIGPWNKLEKVNATFENINGFDPEKDTMKIANKAMEAEAPAK